MGGRGSTGIHRNTSPYKEMSYQYDWNNKANNMRTYTYNGKEETELFRNSKSKEMVL